MNYEDHEPAPFEFANDIDDPWYAYNEELRAGWLSPPGLVGTKTEAPSKIVVVVRELTYEYADLATAVEDMAAWQLRSSSGFHEFGSTKRAKSRIVSVREGQ